MAKQSEILESPGAGVDEVDEVDGVDEVDEVDGVDAGGRGGQGEGVHRWAPLDAEA